MPSKDAGPLRLLMPVYSNKKLIRPILIALTIMTQLFHCGQPTKEMPESTETDFKEALAIPNFSISTINDSTDFHSESVPKNGLLMIKYFSPDCDHCQEEAQTYVSKKDSLANIRTIWISGDWASLQAIREFAEKYQVAQLNPVAIGKETTNDLLAFYGLSGIPFAAVYKDNQLIKAYRGSVDFPELIAINDGTFVPEPMAADSTITTATH